MEGGLPTFWMGDTRQQMTAAQAVHSRRKSRWCTSASITARALPSQMRPTPALHPARPLTPCAAHHGASVF